MGNGVNGYVNTLYVYDSVMCVGGSFTSPGNNIAQWNGSIWDSLSSGVNGSVYAFGVYKGLVYVGGLFSKAGGHSAGSVATWNGKSFANAGFNMEQGAFYNYPGLVDAIQPYDSLLYIGGQFDSVNHKHLSGLATWDGIKVDSLNIRYGSYWENVSILTTYKNYLMLGYAPISSGTPIGSWNNKVITYGPDYFYAAPPLTGFYMNAFCIFNSNLYMGGQFLYYVDEDSINYRKDTVNNIVMWNGKTCSSLGKGINGTVNALISYKNLLIAGGSFDSAGGIPANNIAAWNGTSWSAFGSGINGPVYALAVFDSTLYAGGNFSSPGSGIVKFTTSPKIAVNTVINIDSVNVFPNPNTGQFTVVTYSASNLNLQPSIEIYNVLGQKIYSANLLFGNNIINLGKPSQGIYIYKIFTSEGNLVNPGKLFIE